MWLCGCNHLGRIAMMPVASCIPFPFFALCDDMLVTLVYATCWLYMHLYMLSYMSMHKSCLLVCHPYFNTMKLWTLDANLHLSLADTTFCLIFACFLFRLFDCFPIMLAMSIMLIYIMPLSFTLYTFSFHCLFIGFLSLSLHVHTWSEDVYS